MSRGPGVLQNHGPGSPTLQCRGGCRLKPPRSLRSAILLSMTWGDPCRRVLAQRHAASLGCAGDGSRLLEFQLARAQSPTRNCKCLVALHYPHREVVLGRDKGRAGSFGNPQIQYTRIFPWIQGKGFAQTRICFLKKEYEKIIPYWRILSRATRVMGTQMRASEHKERPPGLHPAFCITLEGNQGFATGLSQAWTKRALAADAMGSSRAQLSQWRASCSLRKPLCTDLGVLSLSQKRRRLRRPRGWNLVSRIQRVKIRNKNENNWGKHSVLLAGSGVRRHAFVRRAEGPAASIGVSEPLEHGAQGEGPKVPPIAGPGFQDAPGLGGMGEQDGPGGTESGPLFGHEWGCVSGWPS